MYEGGVSMYCEKCKKEFSDDRRFCTECGSPLVEKKKGGWKVWHTLLLIGGLLFFFFIIGIIVVVLAVVGIFRYNKKADFGIFQGNRIESEFDTDAVMEEFEYDEFGDIVSGDVAGNIAEDDLPDYGDPNQQNTPAYPSSNSDYVLPDSSTRYLSKSDLYGLSAEQCRIARNEIYARHGRIFQDEGLQAYFSQFSWYQPSIPADAFQESMLNAYEIANRDLIVEYETEQGYR